MELSRTPHSSDDLLAQRQLHQQQVPEASKKKPSFDCPLTPHEQEFLTQQQQQKIEKITRKNLEESQKLTQELMETNRNCRAELEKYQKIHEDLHKPVGPPVIQKKPTAPPNSQSYDWCVIA
ncbi:MAG: hypothetical protein KDK64_06365 [Chlamydiia bacterium]|nr:hypothetical protein [Chlamydiia bacterium]